MYKVYCDDTLICDSRIEELALIDPVIDLEENKAGSFVFKIPPKHHYYGSVKRRKSVIRVYRNDNDKPIFSGIAMKEKEDFFKQKTIKCEGELTYLNDSIQRPKYYQGKRVRGLLEEYIVVHNAQVEEKKQFTVGVVTVEDSNDYISCYTNMQTTMKELKEDLVDDLGGFLRTRYEDGVRYIDYLADSPNTNSQEIRIGRNLLDFTKNFDSSNIATAIIPLGAKLEESAVEGLETRLTIESINDGLDYIHSAEAVEEYGWVYRTVIWDGVTTPEELKVKAEKYLSDIQYENMVIEAKAIDLNLTDRQVEQFKLSDRIRVVSAPHGLDRYFRLTKMKINLNNPEKDTITLGKNEKITLSAKVNKENENIKKTFTELPARILQSAIKNASQLIQTATNGYVTTVMNDDGTPKELLIMDTPNTATATKVWRWNVNGLGYSENGYDGPYEIAITMDGGIVADFINAGTMSADRICGGTLSLGGYDNVRGLAQIFNADGVIVGWMNSEGVVVRSDDARDITWMKEGYTWYYKNEQLGGSVGACGVGMNDETLYGLMMKTHSDLIVFANHEGKTFCAFNPNGKALGTGGYTELFYLAGSSRFNGNMYANKNVEVAGAVKANTADVETNLTVGNEMTAETVICNKMSVQGGAPQDVEWVWDSALQRWCLCTIT